MNKANVSDIDAPFLDLHLFLMVLFLPKFMIDFDIEKFPFWMMTFPVVPYITKTRPCNILQIFTAVKKYFSGEKLLCFSYFCLKHRLWVHFRTHNLCFRAKIRKNVYPCKPQFYYIKLGCKGVFVMRTCFL